MARVVSMSSSHDANALFKEFYVNEGSVSLVNAKTPAASILMKNKKVDWVGDQFVAPVRFGSAVGLGYRASGANLPTPVAAPRGKAVFPAKRAYASVEYDREAILASRNDRGAFAKVTVDETEALIEGFQLHMVERAIFGDGSGKLGQIASLTGAGTVASPWVLTMSTVTVVAPKFKKKYFPKGAKLDVYTAGGVYQLTVQVVGASSTTVSVVLVSTGSAVAPSAAEVLYWEGNKDGEITGLAKFVASGTIYGIDNSVNTEFKGISTSITGALQIDDINSAVSATEEESGESPDIGFCGHGTLAYIKNLMEDQKRYNVSEIKSSDGKIGFKGIQIMSDEGEFSLVASQMCQGDDIWLAKQKYLQLVCRADMGFFDDDGTILLRDPNKDVYNARYGGYFELFNHKPNTIHRITGFTL